jgi:hypothetical protein
MRTKSDDVPMSVGPFALEGYVVECGDKKSLSLSRPQRKIKMGLIAGHRWGYLLMTQVHSTCSMSALIIWIRAPILVRPQSRKALEGWAISYHEYSC